MKKTLLTAALFTIFSSFAQEPVFHWVKSAGSIGYDTGLDLAVDDSGNVITVGSFNATFDFDPGPNVFNMTGLGNNDGFIQKLDPQGNFLWAKQISGNMIEMISHIELDATGNIYLSGEYNATVDFNPGPAVFNMTSTTHVIPSLKSIDVFIVKLDPNGNFIWAKSFGGAEYDAVTKMSLDADGNIILGGYFSLNVDFDPGAGSFPLQSTDDNDDIYFSKLDPNGNFIWAKRIGNFGDDRLQAMTTDDNGNIYGTGYYYGTVDFDPNPGVFNLLPSAADGTNGILQDVFILKLQPGGELSWAKKIGSEKGEMCYAIDVDHNGNVITAGLFSGTVDFDPGDGENLMTSVLQSTFLSKLNNNGDFIWSKNLPDSNSILPTMIRASSDGFYLAAGYRNTANFGENVSVTSVSNTNDDVLIAKIDTDGNGIWVKSMGGTGDDTVYGMVPTGDGSIYSTGSFGSTADMDPGNSVQEVTSAGSNDLFVLRLSPESLAISELENLQDAIRVINPSEGSVAIRFPESWFGAQASIYNVNGQLLTRFAVTQTIVEKQLASGTYILNVASDGKKATEKIILK